MDVGIVGGTGPLGSALGARLASVGLDVVLGSRSPEKAQEAVVRLSARWGDRVARLTGGHNDRVVRADVVVLAVPWEGVVPIALEYADALAGKPVVSVANALGRVGREFVALTPARGSVAQLLQSTLPRAMVVAALHHVPARDLGELSRPVDADTLVASDYPSSAQRVMEVLELVPGLRTLDASPPAGARSSLRLVGLTEEDG